MKRMLLVGAFLLPLVSCQVSGNRSALTPLPEKVTPLPYAQLLQRARALVAKANDAYYVDNWSELEDAARGIEQTAQFLSKADDVPAKHKDTLTTMSADLGKLARSLREAAVAKDVKKINDVMTRLNSKVREHAPGRLNRLPVHPFHRISPCAPGTVPARRFRAETLSRCP